MSQITELPPLYIPPTMYGYYEGMEYLRVGLTDDRLKLCIWVTHAHTFGKKDKFTHISIVCGDFPNLYRTNELPAQDYLIRVPGHLSDAEVLERVNRWLSEKEKYAMPRDTEGFVG